MCNVVKLTWSQRKKVRKEIQYIGTLHSQGSTQALDLGERNYWCISNRLINHVTLHRVGDQTT